MAPRPSRQTSKFGVVFLLSKSLGNWESKTKLESLQFWPESLGTMLQYWYIERGLFRRNIQQVNNFLKEGFTVAREINVNTWLHFVIKSLLSEIVLHPSLLINKNLAGISKRCLKLLKSSCSSTRKHVFWFVLVNLHLLLGLGAMCCKCCCCFFFVVVFFF